MAGVLFIASSYSCCKKNQTPSSLNGVPSVAPSPVSFSLAYRKSAAHAHLAHLACFLHQLNPDIRLVRNIWTKGNPQGRVKNFKFMWGMFACVMSCCVKGLVWLRHDRIVLAAGCSVTRSSAKQENRLYAALRQLLRSVWPSMMYIILSPHLSSRTFEKS
jgi:hypothetical protein